MTKTIIANATVASVIAIGFYLWSYEQTPIVSNISLPTSVNNKSTLKNIEPSALNHTLNKKNATGQDQLKTEPNQPDQDRDVSENQDIHDPGDEAYDTAQVEQSIFPSTEIGEVLQNNLTLTEGIGPDAESIYQDGINKLRQKPQESIELLTDAYEKLNEENYLDRWKLVDTLGAIESGETLDILNKIASSEVPKEKYPDEHSVNSTAEELMIRQAAIRGIEHLANAGDPEAQQSLHSLIKIVQPNVREGVVLAYLRTVDNRQQQVAQLRTELPASDHWILALNEVSDTRLAGDVEMPLPKEEEAIKLDPDKNDTSPEESMPPAGVLP